MVERTERNANPYIALGVRPFINCCSVRTMHGGSLMLPQVRAAMDQASRQFVNLDELMEAAGRRLAELTGAEWGIAHAAARLRWRSHRQPASPAMIRFACCACRSPMAG
jgi:seryl-tRNA(Sec) selenium transferase